jgi:hypothetical protein
MAVNASRIYVFADESGNCDFSRSAGASKYYYMTTVTMSTMTAGLALQELRYELAWEGVGLRTEFHASEDEQKVRDRVFAALDGHDFRIDATILEKSKAFPHVRTTEREFYALAWAAHVKHLLPLVASADSEMLIVGASLGTKKKRRSFHDAISEVVKPVAGNDRCRVAAWEARSDPCLQIADYCAWAIQRKWEKGDERSYRLIADRIHSERDVFKHGTQHHY